MKTLNMVKKGVVIGGVAAALLLGSTIPGFGGAAAHAATTQIDYKAIVERNLSGVVGYVGSIANREDSEVREELMRGQNLVQLSGLTGSELLNRLTASLDQSIDLAARNDKAITKEELGRIKSDAAKRISTIITTGGYDDTKRENVDYDTIINRYMTGLVGYVGGIANRRDSDVRELLQQGKSLTELSGLTGSELLNRLTAPLDQSIDLAARSDKTITNEKLDRIKSDAAKRISTIITTGGYDDTKRENVDYEIIIDRYMSGIVGYVGGIANRRDSDVRELLQQGKSLTELSGLTGSELLNRLTAPLDQSIDLAARSDRTITSEKLGRIKSDAAKQISTIITTGGYDDTKREYVDYDTIISRYMTGLIGYVGGIANRGDSEMRELLQQGKSLTEISGLTGSELLDRLIAPLDQSIDLAARSDNTITNEKLDRIKSDAAKQISTIISTGGY
ncbi:hypothetical protein FE784_32985 [Paenibacillus hemerocallicola]|uniref:SbsC C-terminal domain-containing protein n=1 Tax=Paenibacillus hemerocallicola TaxID=1172614 RepID=A0A5C4SZ46_9BACL|nr:hypothetical protein [Paenibacillus hemerocallicola]TNJ61966.1 hypothetical protein FE784_32985 [Paenibacillus hemerocallicola]